MMKRLKYIFILITALSALSCSKDDDLRPDGTDIPCGELRTFTFSASIDRCMTETGDGQPKTRTRGISANKDDKPTRCYMQVFNADFTKAVTELLSGQKDNGNYTFEVQLAPDATFNYLLWADNGTQSVTDLTSVPYTPNTVAFAASISGTPETVISSGIALTHVVAKVTLATSTETTVEADGEASVSTSCAAAYNVRTSTVSGTQDYTTSARSGSFVANQEITSFYLLPAAEKQNIIINCHLLTQTIADVSVKPNVHITLKGNLSENEGNWESTPQYYEQVFTNIFFREDGTPSGYEEFGTYYYWASDVTNQRIISDILKTTAFPGEYKTVTAPWGEDVYIGYVPSSLEIQYKGKEFIIYTQLELQSNYPNLVLPDKIY